MPAEERTMFTQTRSSRWLVGLAVSSVCFLASATSAEPLGAREILEKMSAEISGLNSFEISGEIYADRRLDEGLLIEHASEVTMKVRRPDAMRLTIRDLESVKELFFAEGIITFYNDLNKYYAQTEAPGDLAATAEFAVHEVGIDAPLLDFLSNSLAARLEDQAHEVDHLGESLIRGQRYHHIAIRLPEMDVQIWVASEGRPLPGKMVLSAKWEGGAPRTVMFFEWDTSPRIPKGTLDFVPPEGASEIEFLLDQSTGNQVEESSNETP
ncbi:MAG: DUF2092 domain-containing protein [Myxococcota bacterium]